MSTERVVDYHQPCYNCITYPVIFTARICGIIPMNVQCARKNRECTFTLSKYWTMHSVLDVLIILFLIGATFQGYSASGLITESKDDLTQIVAFAIDVMNQFSAVCMIIINLHNYQLFRQSFSEISRLMHSSESTLSKAFPKKIRKKIFNHGLIRCCLIGVVLIIQNSITFTGIYRENLVPVWFFVLKSIYFGLSNAVYMLVGVHFTTTSLIYRQLIRQIKIDLDKIMKAMIERKPDNLNSKHAWSIGIRNLSKTQNMQHTYGTVSTLQHPDTFCNQIADLRLVYGSIHKSLMALNKSMNPQLLIITTLALVSVVLSIYLVVQLAIMKIWRLLITVTIIRLVISIINNYFIVTSADNLLKSVKFQN